MHGLTLYKLTLSGARTSSSSKQTSAADMKFLVVFVLALFAFAAAQEESASRDKRGILGAGIIAAPGVVAAAPGVVAAPGLISTTRILGAPGIIGAHGLIAAPGVVAAHGLLAPRIIGAPGLLGTGLIL